MYMKFIPAIACLVLLTGCFDYDIEKPVTSDANFDPNPTKASMIQVPLYIELNDLQKAVFEELKKEPIALGETGELSANLLVNEKTIIEEPQKIVETPYKAAECHIEKVKKEIKQRVKVGRDSFKCKLNPLKWGKCYKDIFEDQIKTIIEDVEKCTPEQLEVVKTVLTPIIKWREATFPTSVNVRYRAELKEVRLTGSGKELGMYLKLNTEVLADVKQGVLGAELKVRGALKCESEVSAEATAIIPIVEEDTDVRIDPKVLSFELKVEELCMPGAVEALQVATYSDAMTAVLRTVVDKEINKQVKSAINKAIGKKEDDLNLSKILKDVVTVTEQPIEIADNIWLTINPETISMTPFSFVGNSSNTKLVSGIGLKSKPIASVGEPTGKIEPTAISFAVGTNSGRFQISPLGVIPLSYIAEVVQQEAEKQISKHAPDLKFGKLSVDVYQGVEKLVFAVRIEDVGFFSRSGTVYLLAKPTLDANRQQISFTDLEFSVASNVFLADYAAWALQGFILENLEEKMQYSFGSDLEKLLAEFSNFQVMTKAGQFSGKLDELTLDSVGIENQNLVFSITAIGSSEFIGKLR